jgi:hypothetical protein
MEVYSIEISPKEISFIRQALDLVNILGKDAKFVADLQTKLENELIQIQSIQKESSKK